MTVSVVIPVYNASRYLRECVDSVLAQTYADIDVVLVDDGSTDESGAICDGYAAADCRVRSLHFGNGGLSVARNRGVEAARGQYVTFVDADDMLHPRCVEVMVDVQEQTGAGIVMVGVTSEPAALSDRGNVHTVGVDEAIEYTLYQTRYRCSQWAKLWPRDALLREPMRPGTWYEDLDSFYRLYRAVGETARGCASSCIAVTSAPLYFYRINGGSFLNNFSMGRLDVLDVVDRIEAYFAGDERLSRAARDRKFSANFNMYILASRHGLDEVAERCWEVIKSYRISELRNPEVRVKNRIGALLSYLGAHFVRGIARLSGMR